MNSFGKQTNCPTSYEILSYVEDSIDLRSRQRVARHAGLCDFCGAELQMLAKYTPAEEDYTPVPRPALISLLGIISVRSISVPAVKVAPVLQARAA